MPPTVKKRNIRMPNYRKKKQKRNKAKQRGEESEADDLCCCSCLCSSSSDRSLRTDDPFGELDFGPRIASNFFSKDSVRNRSFVREKILLPESDESFFGIDFEDDIVIIPPKSSTSLQSDVVDILLDLPSLRKFVSRAIANRRKGVLVDFWSVKDLKKCVHDYINFHLVMTYDQSIEDSYRNQREDHNYLKAFDQLEALNTQLCIALRRTFDLDRNFCTIAPKKPFKFLSRGAKAGLASPFGSNGECCICFKNYRTMRCSVEKYFFFAMSGREYDRKELKDLRHDIASGDPPQEIDPKVPDVIFCFCQEHIDVCQIYYFFVHMRLTVFWNCKVLVQDVRNRKGDNLTMEETLNLVDDHSFKALSAMIMNRYGYVGVFKNISYVEKKLLPRIL